MREKTPKTVVTFDTTSNAIAFESAARKDPEALPGRIIPVPSAISAGCGLSWAAAEKERETLMAGVVKHDLAYEAVYTVDLY